MKKPAIIVALDVPSTSLLVESITRLPRAIEWYKIGLELFCAEGPQVLKPLKDQQKRIFLDLKLHDIPRTVERAVTSIAHHGIDLLTLHASGGRAMLSAAVEAAKTTSDGRMKLLAVTVLTSLDQQDLHESGIQRKPREHALALAEMAYSCGVDGIVCSLHEAAAIRANLGSTALIVTPGIRLPDQSVGDQKRVGTPRDAMLAGATHLVIGRPLMEANDPVAVYDAIQRNLAE